MKNRFFITGSSIIVILIIAIGVFNFTHKGYKYVTSDANYAYSTTFKDLDKTVDAIVIAQPTEKVEDRKNHFVYFPNTNDLNYYYTDTNIEIKAVLKNDGKIKGIEKNNTITITEHFAIKGNTLYTVNGYKPIEKGQKYLLFLEEGATGNNIVLTNLNEGRFSLTSDSEFNKPQYKIQNFHSEIEKEAKAKYAKEIKKALETQ